MLAFRCCMDRFPSVQVGGSMRREPMSTREKKSGPGLWCTGFIARARYSSYTLNLITPYPEFFFSLHQPNMMSSRIGLRATRNFQTSSRVMSNIYGTPKSGLYANLPFPVKTKKIPFAIPFWGVFGFFFAFPFLSSWWHLKKAGNLN